MVSRLRRKIADRLGGAGAIGTASPPASPEGPPTPAMRTTFEGYVHAAPSSQNAVDLFAGEWSSAFPEHAGVRQVRSHWAPTTGFSC